MKQELIELNKKFEKVKKMGYVKSTREGPTGIGKTFEDLIEKKEDTLETPDYKGIEIKTKLRNSKSYITLFNATPKGKTEYEIKRLQKVYGYPDKTLKTYKVFQTSIYSNYPTFIGNKFLFKLEIYHEKKAIFLKILDKNFSLIEEKIYWSFSLLEEKLNRKLKYLAVVKVFPKHINNITYYKYYSIAYYQLKNFSNFLKLIEEGTIRITFHIGIFKTGKRFGEIHDRGTSFEIQEKNLFKLFDKIEKF